MEDRKQLVEQYQKWILLHESKDYQISQNDSGNIELLTKTHIGRVNFYPEEIMELRIDRLENDATVFFLHFQMNTVEHAHVMFEELEKALVSLSEDNHVEILLSCTGGLTTSYFAAALNEAAEQMKLNYSFSAMACDELKEKGVGYDAVLLAPQIAFMREEIQEALKGTSVINIPPTVFGGYDANKLIEIVEEELKVKKEQETPNNIRMAQYFKTTEDILTFICTKDKISYRYYEHGSNKETKDAVKDGIVKENILNTIEQALQEYPNTTMIAVSVEDKVDHVLKNKEFKKEIEEKFGKRAVVYKEGHMCVTGLYWLSDHYKSLVYYKDKDSMTEAGVMVNGHLVRGKGYCAGQTSVLNELLKDESKEQQLAKVLTMIQSTIGTEAFYIQSDVKDIDEVKKYMEQWIDTESMPDIHLVENCEEDIFTGLFLRGVWNKEHHARRNNGLLKYKG